MMNKPLAIRLLIIEDQVDLAENLFEFLGEDHYELDFAADGLTALHLLATQQYDVIVLDIMLPGVSGFDICRKIRNDLRCLTPIIMMTALDDINNKEKGFEGGADDYLVKPFELRELKLRIDALHRRRSPQMAQLRAGDIQFSPGTLQATYCGFSTELSGTSARLFELLVRAHPNYLSHDALCDALWGSEHVDCDGSSLRTHVYTLRKSLKSGLGHAMVKTVHGRGYRIEPPAHNGRKKS